MGHDLFVAALVGSAAIALLWLLTRQALHRAALARVLRQPALLVPAAMSGALGLVFALLGMPEAIAEQPFATAAERLASAPAAWLGFLAITVALAGQIGLLEADDVGLPADGHAFASGVRRHTATALLARSVAAALGFALWCAVGPTRDPLLVVWLVPQLFVASSVGIASEYPSRPLAAALAQLRFALAKLGSIGAPVIAHALFLLGLGLARARFDALDVPLAGHALGWSSLGYNLFPQLRVGDSVPAAVVATLASAVASTVFLTAHWLGVRHGYGASPPARGHAGPDAG
jgi:hypothetical protein